MSPDTMTGEGISATIVGTWRMLSWRRVLVGTGEETDPLGPSPFGYINYSPDGRLMVFVLKSGRPRPTSTPPTDEEKLALFDTLLAYVGTYTVEQDRVIHKIDGSWNELWTESSSNGPGLSPSSAQTPTQTPMTAPTPYRRRTP